MNDSPRRYPRTLQEAFGPYTSRSVYEPPRVIPVGRSWFWRLIFTLFGPR